MTDGRKVFLALVLLAFLGWLVLVGFAAFMVVWTGHSEWAWLIAAPLVLIFFWKMYQDL